MSVAVASAKPLPRHVLAYFASQPWAMEPRMLQTMAKIVSRQTVDVDAIQAEIGQPLANTESGELHDGVAVLKIVGPLFRYADWFTAMCGGATYETLATDFSAALNDTKVEAIVLDINSPGGEVDGCAELSELIYQARGTKPIIAYVSNLGCSAAYFLASACERVIAADMAVLGSIGVRMAFTDDSVALERDGLRELEIISSQSPRKAGDPFTDAGRASMQALADSLAAVFIDTVARNRGVTSADVISRFGQGDVLVGAQAVAAGLADDVGTLESVFAELLSSPSPYSSVRTSTMAFLNRNKSAPAAAVAFAEQAQVKSMVARGVTVEEGAVGTVTKVVEGVTAYGVDFGNGDYLWLAESELAAADAPASDAAPPAAARSRTVAQIELDARAAERTRITGILALSGPGRADLVAAAIADPACSIDQAGLRIAQLQQDLAHLAALRADERGSKTPAAVSSDNAQPTLAQQMLAVHARINNPAGR